MPTKHSHEQNPHGNRFSLRNPVMAIWVGLLWLIAALQIGASFVARIPAGLPAAIRWLTYAALALGIVHVIVGGILDLRKAGPDAPRGFRHDRRSLTFGWLFCLVVALVAFQLSPTPESGLRGTAMIFGATAIIGMVLQVIQARRTA